MRGGYAEGGAERTSCAECMIMVIVFLASDVCSRICRR